MAKSTRQQVFEGMELLPEALIPFVEKRLESSLKGHWQVQVLEKLPGLRPNGKGEVGWDQAALFNAMDRFWMDAFKAVLGRAERSLVNELVDVRNKLSHNETFTYDDAERALDSMRRLMEAISAGETAEQLSNLERELAGIENNAEIDEAAKPALIEKARAEWKLRNEAVLNSGGLHIIGCERHESRRIDNQLRGRSGRQGDPGASNFFLSLEDDLMRIFGSEPSDGMLRRLGLEEGDTLIAAAVTDGAREVMLFSDGGKVIRFKEKHVRTMGRTARGVRGMRLPEGQRLISMLIPEPNAQILTASLNGYGKRTVIDEFPRRGRGGQGVIAMVVNERNGELVGAAQVFGEEDIMLISNQGTLVRTGVNQVSTSSRNTQGVRLIRLDRKSVV